MAANNKSQVADEDVQAKVKELFKGGAKPFGLEYPEDAHVTEFDEIAVDLSIRDYLVKSLIHRGDVGVIFGPSGSGKTFFALDLALHVATGAGWREHRVRKAFVLYVASENPRSVTKRVAAWREQHDPEGGVPFALMGGAIDLRDSECVGCIIQAVKVGASRFKCESVLVFVDTLARAAPGIEENESSGMGAVIASADRIRDQTQAAVCFIHHSGKDTERGARGHSSLKGAVDFEIAVSDKVATVSKARDAELGGAYPFRLDRVELGTDSDGDIVSTCIVVPTDAPPTKPRVNRVPAAAREAYRVLVALLAVDGEVRPGTSAMPVGVRSVEWTAWRDKFEVASRIVTSAEDDPEKAGAAFRQRWKRSTEALQNAGSIGSTGQKDGYVWVTDPTVTP